MVLLMSSVIVVFITEHGNGEGEEGVDQLCGGAKRITEDMSCSSQDHDQYEQGTLYT